MNDRSLIAYILLALVAMIVPAVIWLLSRRERRRQLKRVERSHIYVDRGE